MSSGGRQGLKNVLVDSIDEHLLDEYTWRVSSNGRVVRSLPGGYVYLHQQIMGGKGIDHVNHNPLDNRRSNLRFANQSQNQHNKRKSPGKTTPYKGVTFEAGKFRARIKPVNRSRISLGRFDSAWAAARAYNIAARELFGEYAHLNERIN